MVVRRARVVGGIAGYRRSCRFAIGNGELIDDADRRAQRSSRRWWSRGWPNESRGEYRTSGLVQNTQGKRIRRLGESPRGGSRWVLCSWRARCPVAHPGHRGPPG